MRSPLSLTVVPVEVVRSGAFLVAAGFARDSLAPDIAQCCLGCSAWFVTCLLWVCLLHAGVRWIDSALARVALLDIDLLLPPLSLVTVALLPLIFLLFIQLCVYIGGWARVQRVFELTMRDEPSIVRTANSCVEQQFL